ncbi:hypothetical protein DM47_3662 [Burkholderia mallei]|nr:hypothetical protein DM75_266 [Burkholderia mallei]KOS76767.1 hypothetical protein DM46_2927 [Burkholderia mallei]KOS85166.1 hypothetical protein DM53_2628 [Burkholderia mallei]KOS95638.1 hypothetical protein DM45_4029 [Burkholderia mallei]KOS97820.1 hypothetical protein DM49_4148 [Burkholderia mallei]
MKLAREMAARGFVGGDELGGQLREAQRETKGMPTSGARPLDDEAGALAIDGATDGVSMTLPFCSESCSDTC